MWGGADVTTASCTPSHDDALRERRCGARPPNAVRDLQPRPIGAQHPSRCARGLADLIALERFRSLTFSARRRFPVRMRTVRTRSFFRPHRAIHAPQHMLDSLRRELGIGDAEHPYAGGERFEPWTHGCGGLDGDDVHAPSARRHRMRELLPPARADRRVGREVIADHEQPARVLRRRASLLEKRRRNGPRTHRAHSLAMDTNANARARSRHAIDSPDTALPTDISITKRTTGASVRGSKTSSVRGYARGSEGEIPNRRRSSNSAW